MERTRKLSPFGDGELDAAMLMRRVQPRQASPGAPAAGSASAPSRPGPASLSWSITRWRQAGGPAPSVGRPSPAGPSHGGGQPQAVFRPRGSSRPGLRLEPQVDQPADRVCARRQVWLVPAPNIDRLQRWFMPAHSDQRSGPRGARPAARTFRVSRNLCGFHTIMLTQKRAER